jgi:hypothetical protein
VLQVIKYIAQQIKFTLISLDNYIKHDGHNFDP